MATEDKPDGTGQYKEAGKSDMRIDTNDGQWQYGVGLPHLILGCPTASHRFRVMHLWRGMERWEGEMLRHVLPEGAHVIPKLL